jgi:methyl-accepting chemotaxis protein
MQDEIFANISHELKTPLNVIFSANQLMELYLKNDLLEDNRENFSKGINIIKQNCYRLIKLINNIIDLSKMESGFLKLNIYNENIVQVVEDIVQSVSEHIKEKGISIVFDTNTEEKIIACDPEKIERIILNLISNAIKFTNTDGRIFINILDKGDSVELTVEDTGIGMDKKHQVDKSLSRNAEGSGIGLSLVKSIVELHGGKISVDSTPGEGTIFKVELPARTIKNEKIIEQIKTKNNKIEIITIEFSDIYSK